MRAPIWHVRKKKLDWRTRFGTVQIHEQTCRVRRTQKLLRPFSAAAEVTCRGYSLGLQRVLTDFGADHSFAQAVAKVKEHYLIDVPVSAARNYTQGHATKNKQHEAETASLPRGGVAQVIAETDGCLIPIVKIAEKGPKDRRKRRLLDWQEARLSLAYRAGSVVKQYQATWPASNYRPVRACWRYLSNRLTNLDYQGAIAAGLPIGSGEIESGNRSVIQARLKRSGAWWKEENFERAFRKAFARYRATPHGAHRVSKLKLEVKHVQTRYRRMGATRISRQRLAYLPAGKPVQTGRPGRTQLSAYIFHDH